MPFESGSLIALTEPFDPGTTLIRSTARAGEASAEAISAAAAIAVAAESRRALAFRLLLRLRHGRPLGNGGIVSISGDGAGGARGRAYLKL